MKQPEILARYRDLNKYIQSIQYKKIVEEWKSYNHIYKTFSIDGSTVKFPKNATRKQTNIFGRFHIDPPSTHQHLLLGNASPIDRGYFCKKIHQTFQNVVNRKLNVCKINRIKKLVRIGLAHTLIPSSFIYLIFMGGTGPCDSIKIILGYHIIVSI